MISNEIKRVLITIVLITSINFLYFSVCNYFECYQLSFMNLMKTNLICNGCNSLTYHIMNYQMEIYLAIGIYLTSSLKKTFDDTIDKIMNF